MGRVGSGHTTLSQSRHYFQRLFTLEVGELAVSSVQIVRCEQTLKEGSQPPNWTGLQFSLV